MNRRLGVPAALALWLSALAGTGPALAAPKAEDCLPLEGFGCYYTAGPPQGSREAGLLVYLRGWCVSSGDDRCAGDYGGIVPSHKLLDTARNAFVFNGLGEAAGSAGLALLVSGSSHLALDAATLARLEQKLGIKVTRLVLASHSGAWLGLLKTEFPALPKVERLVLLDNFYFYEDGARTLKVEVLDRGASCAGFYTEQGEIKYRDTVVIADYGAHVRGRLAPVLKGCALESRGDEHYAAVPGCLKRYLAGASCPSRKTSLSPRP